MKKVASKATSADWRLPPGYQSVDVDPSTGYLATEFCPRHRQEIYPDELLPKTACALHQPAQSWFRRLFSGREQNEYVEKAVAVEREMQVDGITIIDLSSHAVPAALAESEVPSRIEPLQSRRPDRTQATNGQGGE